MAGGGPKSFELPEGGDQKVFRSKGGGQKSLVKLKVFNENQNAQFVAKINSIYSLRLDLYFKIFPGPSAGLALHLTLKMPPLAHPQVRLAFV